MRFLWFGSKALKPTPAPRPTVLGVDGSGEMILSSSRPVYNFRPMLDVSPAVKARDDELVAALMAMETCDVCTMPMNVCSGHSNPLYFPTLS